MAAPLRVDPADPPVAFDRGDDGVWLAFPGGVELRTDPAILVSLAPGRLPSPTLAAQGRPLGRSGRHWRVPVDGDVVDAALAWASEDGVLDAIPDVWLPKVRHATFDDPDRGAQWYLDLLEMDPLFDESLGDASVRVAVIDGATDILHPDLAGGIDAPFDAVDGDDDPSPGPECEEPGASTACDDHGTGVSGIIGARANNGTNLVGMCPECTVIPIRMIGGPASADILAFEHAIDSDAWVVNNSWGYTVALDTPFALGEVIARAADEGRGGKGMVVVFASGNDDRRLENTEVTGEPGVFCVGATDRYHLPTAYTNFGRSVDIAAPSATVTLAPGGGLNTTFGGTSAAAPVVSGLSGWMLSVDPELTAVEVTDLLVATAHKTSLVTFDATGHHDTYGYGELDPGTVLAALRGEWPPAGVDSGSVQKDRKGCGCDGSASFGAASPLLLLWLRRRR